MRMFPSVLLALVLVSCAGGVAHAAWPHDPTQSLSLGNGTIQTTPIAVPDGAGGFISAWYEARSGSMDIVAQRVDARGNLLWGAGGVVVCNASLDQYLVAMIADKSGGAYLLWTDYRNFPTAPDLYAGRVTSSGSVPWGTSGVSICSVAGSVSYPSMTLGSSVAGDAIIVWSDPRNGNDDIYTQRVNASGSLQFPTDGIPVCTATGNQWMAQAVIDQNGYFLVAWADYRTGVPDIYLQRVHQQFGTMYLAANGVAVCNAAGDQLEPQLISDGANGALLAWTDGRGANKDIYAHYVNFLGAPIWAVNGVAVCSATGDQVNPRIAPIGTGGMALAWVDYRASISNSDIYAQRINGYGTGQWTANGVAVASLAGVQQTISMAVDGASNMLLAWRDFRDALFDADVYVQRLSPGGVPAWTANGVGACVGAPYQFLETSGLVADGKGGAFVVFTDMRSYMNQRAWGQHVDEWGMLGAEPVIADVTDVPNDEGGFVKVAWNASPLDLDPAFRTIADYRVYRSVPPGVAEALLARGAATLDDAAGRGRALVTTVSGTAVYYWEQIASATAEHLDTYSVLAPTAGDSTGGGNPVTAWMVRARTANGAQWWDSAPDSGYSVDDLAPAAPAPFTGEYAGGATTLHWNPNAEPDVAAYRLHRGNTPGFTPDPANLVASLPDTGYVDPAGQPYFYKLAAVDAHGNVGPYAFLQPAGTVDVPAEAPAVLALAPATPNPTRAGTELRFTLPRASRARLAMYDVGGRCVRTLTDGARAAGSHAVRWDGRDAAGRSVAPGLYFSRLEVEGRSVVTRVVVAR